MNMTAEMLKISPMKPNFEQQLKVAMTNTK